MLRPRPRPSPRGWRRREAGAEPAGPGRWLRLLLPPLLPSPHPPQLQPAGSPVQPRCPGARARPRPGSPAHRVFSLVRPERATATPRPDAAMGNTLHRTLPGTPGSPTREAGAGVLLSLGDALGDFRRATPPTLGALGGRGGLEPPVLPDSRLSARGAAELCALGGRVPRPGYLGDPGALSPGFGQMREGAVGAMLRDPLPLFPPKDADEGARGAPGG